MSEDNKVQKQIGLCKPCMPLSTEGISEITTKVLCKVAAMHGRHTRIENSDFVMRTFVPSQIVCENAPFFTQGARSRISFGAANGAHRGGVQAGYESAKIENGPARGKKHYDKRKDIVKRDAKRDIGRRMKHC